MRHRRLARQRRQLEPLVRAALKPEVDVKKLRERNSQTGSGAPLAGHSFCVETSNFERRG
jgi:hypothetical protein